MRPCVTAGAQEVSVPNTLRDPRRSLQDGAAYGIRKLGKRGGGVRLNGTGECAASLNIFVNGDLLFAVIGQSGIFMCKCLVMSGIVIPFNTLLIGMSTVQFPLHAGQVNLMGSGDVPSLASTENVDPATMSCDAVTVMV